MPICPHFTHVHLLLSNTRSVRADEAGKRSSCRGAPHCGLPCEQPLPPPPQLPCMSMRCNALRWWSCLAQPHPGGGSHIEHAHRDMSDSAVVVAGRGCGNGRQHWQVTPHYCRKPSAWWQVQHASSQLAMLACVSLHFIQASTSDRNRSNHVSLQSTCVLYMLAV
jgi:hypothetical protein